MKAKKVTKSSPRSKAKPASSAAEVVTYLAKLPKSQRIALGNLRKIIKGFVPVATEGFSYGMPAFKYFGHSLVGYDAFKEHCSLFPMSPKVQATFSRELKAFHTSKGTIQFPPDQPLPAGLVKRILKARIKEIEERYGTSL
jgi:uncharacterized protein YdhG (YjbR/CyaY superfamily)